MVSPLAIPPRTSPPQVAESVSAQDLRVAWPTPPAEFCFELPSQEVHLWAFTLDCKPSEIATFTSLLNVEELRRAKRYHFSRDRNRFVCGRAQLRCLLARYLRISPVSLNFVFNRQGKPALDPGLGLDGVQFNLAHCEGLAVFAAARSDCGIDLERVRQVPEQEDLVKRFFSPQESAAFFRLPRHARPAAFFNLWTRKEAWLKAVGLGITFGLDQVEVSFLPGKPARLLGLPTTFQDTAAWTLESFEPASRFVGAVALSKAPKTLLKFHFLNQRPEP